MKKYRLEICIGSIFGALLTALFWKSLQDVHSLLPLILVGLTACVFVFSFLPSKRKDEFGNEIPDDSEKYAPKYFAQAAISSAVGIGIIIGLAVLFNNSYLVKSFDLTENKINSLSTESEKFVSALEKDVRVYCIPAQEASADYCGNNYNLLNLYARRSKHFIYHGVVDLRNKQLLEQLQPSGFARIILVTDDNKSEQSGAMTESKITNALINLVKYKKYVHFLNGSGEPSLSPGGDRSYSDLVEALRIKAYHPVYFNLKNGDLPADARVLVVGDNSVTYDKNVEKMLFNFLARGGKLIVILNPYRETGLNDFFEKLGVKLDPILLTLNKNTSLGSEIAKQNQMRPPVLVSEFNFENPVTSAISQAFQGGSMMPVDGARPMTLIPQPAGLKFKALSTNLMAAVLAAPITLTPEQRNAIDLNSPFLLQPDQSFDPKKEWNISIEINIDKASQMAVDMPIPKVEDPAKDKTNVIVFGFQIISPYSKPGSLNLELLKLAIAHLYEDKELVSIPPRDLRPKQFDISRNPAAYLQFFAAILPILTAIIGFVIWFRRRSA